MAQWLKHAPGVMEVMDSNPYQNSENLCSSSYTQKSMNWLNITTVGSLLFQHGQELEENTHAYTRNRGQRNTENIANFWHFPCITCPLSRVHVQHSVHSFVLNVKIRDFHLAVCWLIIINCHQCITGLVSQSTLVHILYANSMSINSIQRNNSGPGC